MGLLALVVIALAIGAVQVFGAAGARYDAALARQAAAAVAVAEQFEELDEVEADAAAPIEIGRAILASAADGYVDAPAKAELAASVDSLATIVEDPAAGLDRPGPIEPGPRPFWTFDLDRETEGLDRDTARLEGAADAANDRAEDVRDATRQVMDDGTALVATVPATAASVDAATVSASNPDRIALRAAIAGVAAADPWSLDAATRIQAYVAAAGIAQASHAAEDAERAGALYSQRVAAEAFARSIAGGVLIEFDWAPVVNGFGTGGSYGGWATWEHGAGVATIDLSDSVAELWPSDGVKALIAHEVGHAMVAKCTESVPATASRELNEAWATAWAIGMGFTADGSGESIYGRPSDALIEQSKSCR